MDLKIQFISMSEKIEELKQEQLSVTNKPDDSNGIFISNISNRVEKLENSNPVKYLSQLEQRLAVLESNQPHANIQTCRSLEERIKALESNFNVNSTHIHAVEQSSRLASSYIAQRVNALEDLEINCINKTVSAATNTSPSNTTKRDAAVSTENSISTQATKPVV